MSIRLPVQRRLRSLQRSTMQIWKQAISQLQTLRWTESWAKNLDAAFRWPQRRQQRRQSHQDERYLDRRHRRRRKRRRRPGHSASRRIPWTTTWPPVKQSRSRAKRRKKKSYDACGQKQVLTNRKPWSNATPPNHFASSPTTFLNSKHHWAPLDYDNGDGVRGPNLPNARDVAKYMFPRWHPLFPPNDYYDVYYRGDLYHPPNGEPAFALTCNLVIPVYSAAGVKKPTEQEVITKLELIRRIDKLRQRELHCEGKIGAETS